MKKELLFSVTKNDCEWSYTKGTGAGGQKRNKTSSAVHCHHRPSGAHGYSEASRSQLDNKRDAFVKMANTKEFQTWNRMEAMRRLGLLAEIDAKVAREMAMNTRLEIKIDGKWTEVKESMLVDDPEDFRMDMVV
jgi:putative lipase involved disintegration of autophagic bodies